MSRRKTDFESYGLATYDVDVDQRTWLFTIDFEAFRYETLDAWLAGMRAWRNVTRRLAWPSCFFIAVEDLVRLELERPTAYRTLLSEIQDLAENGSMFYPHNHGVFDQETGRLATNRRQNEPGYAKRASMFFDVVYRHRVNFSGWLNNVVEHYDRFLGAAGLPPPAQPAFRAGGWDHGASKDDSRVFVESVARAGFVWDSSASSGTFGSRSWRVGAPFGRNVYRLGPTLTEAASCWSVDRLEAVLDPHTVYAFSRLIQPRLWLRRPGVFVSVFHFNKLIDRMRSGDGRTANDVVEAFFRKLSLVRSGLRIPLGTFDSMVVPDGVWPGLVR